MTGAIVSEGQLDPVWRLKLVRSVVVTNPMERSSPIRDGAWRDMGEVIAHVTDNGWGRVMAHLLGDSDETGCHDCRVHEDETCHHVWVKTDSFAGHEGGILVPG